MGVEGQAMIGSAPSNAGRLPAEIEDRLAQALRNATLMLEGDALHMPDGQGKRNLYTITSQYRALLAEVDHLIVLAEGPAKPTDNDGYPWLS
jgi:hypothetical protein